MGARVFTFLMILAGMSAMLSLAGVQTGIGLLIDATGVIDNPESFKSSNFFSQASAALAALAVVGIIVGLFTRQSPESVALIGLCTMLLAFVGDFISILIYLSEVEGGGGWIAGIGALFMIPIIVGYTVSILEFWRGVD